MGYNPNQMRDYAIEFMIILGFLGGIALGIEIGYGYFSISILSLGLLFIFHRYKNKSIHKIYKSKIKEQWGKEHKEKRDFKNIEKLFRFQLEREGNSFHIDDITWQDLNMDSVFSKIDHTKSLPGMQYLYYILRSPSFDKDILEKRNRVISLLLNHKDISQKLQFPLYLLGKDEGKDIFNYFRNGIKVDTTYSYIYKFFSYLPLLLIVMLIINRPKAILMLIIFIGFNTWLYNLNKKKIYEEMETFIYLGKLLRCAQRIVDEDMEGIDIDQDRLRDLLKRVEKVRKNIRKLSFSESAGSEKEIFVHYYNMLLLREPKIFYKTVDLLNRYREDFYEIYLLIGKIDAFISVASYRDGLKYYTEPNLVEEKTKFHIKAEEVYHPLIDEPVPYSFELNNTGALVTGSNASGKSTFLRTIGINSIFSQTLYLALAKSFSSSYFKLLTSIGTTDNIVEGDSYFMAEAKSLKRILDILDPNQPVLCILDEIFRGTNTAERISAAKEALNYMIERNCCVVAATHDLELTNLVNERYRNYHFREIIEEKDIKFDYILRDGPCTTRNAIAILKYLGYPEELYGKAMASAENYIAGNVL
ncbi:MAG: DNA mismatch repair protein MutS [Tissierellia bacterium]|nr:DNA mismatch repair protein MutS [Tissierellia bacterium]